MATVTPIPPSRKTSHVTHYAYLGDCTAPPNCSTAPAISSAATGERKATLVSYRDPSLTLLGRVDLADAQRAADDAAGGLAALVCGYGKGR